MTDNTPDDDANRSAAPNGGFDVSRRSVLRGAAAGGLAALGIGTGFTGSAAAQAAGAPPALHREGTDVVDANGDTVWIRGINIADPKRVDVSAPARGRNAVQAIDLATDASAGWHANAIRLPVQPVDIGEHTPGAGPPPIAFDESQLEAYCNDHLDAAVQKCADEGVYAIVDYHRHRDIPWNDDTLSDEVEMFWDFVADRYADESHVIFEVFNEPQGNANWGATGQALVDWWGTYKATAQPWVDTIRSNADNFTLVGSPRWSQASFGPVIEEFDGEDLGYTVHLYPAHGPTTPADYDAFLMPPGDGDYDSSTGTHEIAPVFMTEWGWDVDASASSGLGAVDEDLVPDWGEHDPNYGANVTEWFATRGIHSTAWCFDPLWQPAMMQRDFDLPDEETWIDTLYEGGDVPELAPSRPADWVPRSGEGYMGDDVQAFLARVSPSGGPPQDITGDGVMDDIDGDGDADLDDVHALVDNSDSHRVQGDVAAFDQDGDGSLDRDDIVDLFQLTQ